MELSKPGQTAALQSGLSPSQQLSSSDNQLPIFASANWVITPNRPNNTNPASLSIRPFNAPSRILMPWESVAAQSPNPTPVRPEKFSSSQNNPTLNKKLPQLEVSPKPTATKSATKASNKRTIQQIEVSPKAQSASAIESVRSKLRESLTAALSVATEEKASEGAEQQNGEEKANLNKEAGQDDCESMVDELLQGNGLSWAENSQSMPDDNILKAPREDEKSLAIKIEAELFGLFGGVNKKYKEKGRSLLFNLKDPSNPELRLRVLSGDIKPEKLCLMSAEELASKELSEWRQAKAQEMAQAIVLPDADVDMRKRVKKTHKGEFVVIEDEKDSSWAPLEAEIKAGASVGVSVGRVEQSVKDVKVEDEAPDLMLEMMGDGFEDVDHLSPVVTLDEFMKDLDSEPPFVDLGISNAEGQAAQAPAQAQTKPSIEKEEKSTSQSDTKDEQVPSEEASKDAKQEGAEVASTVDANSKEDKEGKVASVDESTVKADPLADKLEVSSGKIIGEHGEALWEGVVQLNVSSLASVVALYKSGEKPSMKEWPGFIEIKGRVRLEPFEKFLKDLPLSRSRAIMIVDIKWKEGSMESGQKNLSETIESYIADARVGFAEPSPGVELYLSPTNEKMLEMFTRLLPNEHSVNLKASSNGLIGVVVWRRPLVTTVSPRPNSQHNPQSTTNKKSNNNNRKKEQVINFNSPKPSRSSMSARDPVKHAASNTKCDDDDDGDVPPGFGHMVNKADNNKNSRNYDDDLPEFDFGSASKNANKGVSSVVRPVQQLRELIQKYGVGSGGTGTGTGVSFKKPTIETKPWNDNDDDDDIPEWNPNKDNRLPVNSLPTQPQISPHNMHSTQNIPPIQAAQYIAPSQQILQPPQETLVPQATFRPGINVQPNYQATSQWWGQGTPGQVDMTQQPSQFGYRMPNTGWRPDFQGNRGV
ncbi:hypothetical protein LUZ61_015758 [Rhynchospora tenuis]|uniref:TFIIS central domain-containing protein n=1 Tax=Rhynchospora tenuis TaxID=198213 RepID=A0AAD5Z491_9POAL|nr:hypothetical protein LUZ61_015758 [Rhynchospora tenuis]